MARGKAGDDWARRLWEIERLPARFDSARRQAEGIGEGEELNQARR
jgi:hypothetical protein